MALYVDTLISSTPSPLRKPAIRSRALATFRSHLLLGDSAGIDYETGLTNPDKDKPRNSALAKYAMEYKKKLNEVDTEELKKDEESDIEEPKGLMARKK